MCLLKPLTRLLCKLLFRTPTCERQRNPRYFGRRLRRIEPEHVPISEVVQAIRVSENPPNLKSPEREPFKAHRHSPRYFGRRMRKIS